MQDETRKFTIPKVVNREALTLPDKTYVPKNVQNMLMNLIFCWEAPI